jgi:hypothetical protein
MSNSRKVHIEALIEEETPVTEAIRLGSIEAMKQYIRAGESMVSWQDGKIVMIPPEKLTEMLENHSDD